MLVNREVMQRYQSEVLAMADTLKQLNNKIAALDGDKAGITASMICLAAMAEYMAADMDNMLYADNNKLTIDDFEPDRG